MVQFLLKILFFNFVIYLFFGTNGAKKRINELT